MNSVDLSSTRVSEKKGIWLDRAAQALNIPVSRLSRILNVAGMAGIMVMMLLTVTNVTLRYVFNRPIIGSDEIIQIMMAISVAFGLAYTGVHKGHVKLDLVTSRLPARAQGFVNSVSWIISICIFALVAWQSILHAANLKAAGSTTAALSIPLYPFVYIVAFGSIMLCLVFLVEFLNHLAQTFNKIKGRSQAGLLSGILLMAMVFTLPLWAVKFGWQVSPSMVGIIGIILLIALTFSGMYVGILMALLGFLGLAYINGVLPGLKVLGQSPFTEMFSYEFSVLPLFVLMGEFCGYSGISDDLFSAAYKWLGHLPGGLALATIGACAGFAAISGSSLAEVATMSAVALPEMKKYKYSQSLAAGSIAAGACLGILIPPSVMLVIYGILAEQSIGELFIAGFIPGILLALFYIIAIYVMCKRNPFLGPPGQRSSLIERLVSLKDTWGVLALFVLVIGGLYVGVFTPTEAAGVGAFGALFFALGKRKLNWKNFTASLAETSKVTAMVFLLLIGATILGYFLAVSRLPYNLAALVAGLQINRYVIFGLIVLVYLFLGGIMSALVMIILTVPIFLPVLTSLGFDPIWFGIIIILMVELAQITPPFAMNIFVISSIAKDIPLPTIYRGIVPFFIMDLLLVILITAFPALVLFLPNLMK